MTYCFRRYMKAFFNPQTLFFSFSFYLCFFLLFFSSFCSRCNFVETHEWSKYQSRENMKFCEILSLTKVDI